MQLLVPDDVGLVLALAMMIANGNGVKCVELILIPHPGCRAYDGVVGARVSRPNPPSRGVVLPPSLRAETRQVSKLWFFGLLENLKLWIIGFLVFWNFGLLEYWRLCAIVYTVSYPESNKPIIQSSKKPKNQ